MAAISSDFTATVANSYKSIRCWDGHLVAFKMKDYDYYDNSIKLLNLIILSGNYWQ